MYIIVNNAQKSKYFYARIVLKNYFDFDRMKIPNDRVVINRTKKKFLIRRRRKHEKATCNPHGCHVGSKRPCGLWRFIKLCCRVHANNTCFISRRNHNNRRWHIEACALHNRRFVKGRPGSFTVAQPHTCHKPHVPQLVHRGQRFDKCNA